MAAVVRDASAEGGFMVQVPAVDFTISCEYNGQTVNVSGFSACVEREIAIPKGVDVNPKMTAVVVEPDGTSRQVSTERRQIFCGDQQPDEQHPRGRLPSRRVCGCVGELGERRDRRHGFADDRIRR